MTGPALVGASRRLDLRRVRGQDADGGSAWGPLAPFPELHKGFVYRLGQQTQPRNMHFLK